MGLPVLRLPVRRLRVRLALRTGRLLLVRVPLRRRGRRGRRRVRPALRLRLPLSRRGLRLPVSGRRPGQRGRPLGLLWPLWRGWILPVPCHRVSPFTPSSEMQAFAVRLVGPLPNLGQKHTDLSPVTDVAVLGYSPKSFEVISAISRSGRGALS
ncbi:hypothetical protein GCM10009850_045900 [Nonomuraea monospora]|uniref:Uncharacterized protein n=1 Tax=Nonomuraea monospora TaxID=568818 RepID=A0ABN3CI96_9ACTN